MQARRRFQVTYCEQLQSATRQLIESVLPDDLMMISLSNSDEASVRFAVAHADVLLVARTRIDGRLLDHAPHVRLVQHQGVGYDNVDIAALKERGIRLALTPVGSEAVAEHTVLLMLAALRNLTDAVVSTRAGAWEHYALRMRSTTLQGKRVGLIGAGRIARGVAARLRGWEVDVSYWARTRLDGPTEDRLRMTFVDRETVLRTSDVLSLHVPLTDETFGIIGRDELAALPWGALVVNTARGPLIDESALAEALVSGHVGAAGLDVFDHEPVPPSCPLLSLSNVVVTPHMAGATPEVIVAKMRHAFDNVGRLRQGLPLRDEVTIA